VLKTTIVSDTKKYPEALVNRIIDVQPAEKLGTQINRKFGFRKVRIVIENKPNCQQQKTITALCPCRLQPTLINA
jgi:hypothetical protein